MKIAVFGGSFDPPHIGHVAIVQAALAQLPIDLLIVVPTYLNPFKKSFAAPPSLRLRWLKKIFLPYKKVRVCDFEIRQNRPTYAIETVRYLKKRYAPTKIYYLIGSDNLVHLHKWHNYKKLKKEVEFVVFTRRGYEVKGKKYKTLRIDVPISSTELRAKPQQRYLPKIVARPVMKFYKD
jgi:nicotinate-nucleotide adenylyltransferase